MVHTGGFKVLGSAGLLIYINVHQSCLLACVACVCILINSGSSAVWQNMDMFKTQLHWQHKTMMMHSTSFINKLSVFFVVFVMQQILVFT